MSESTAEQLEVMALRTQLERARTMQLRELEGMRACLEGTHKGACPYEGAEKDTWLMGYLQQEREMEITAINVALRQALKTQAMAVEEYIDVDDEKASNPTSWWWEYLTDEAEDAFRENPEFIKLVENIIKSSIALVTKRAFRFSADEGVVLDSEQLELFDNLNHAVEIFLERKRG